MLLAEAVAREPWPTGEAGRPLEAIEIGCGVGLAGLVALGRGLRVCFSDYDEAAVQFVARSGRRPLGLTARDTTSRCWTGETRPRRPIPSCWVRTCSTSAGWCPSVANLLAKMLAPGGLGLIACPGRASAEGFPAALTALGLDCRIEPVESRDADNQPIRGILYRITRGGWLRDSGSRGRSGSG